jgi:hypothetical protein
MVTILIVSLSGIGQRGLTWLPCIQFLWPALFHPLYLFPSFQTAVESIAGLTSFLIPEACSFVIITPHPDTSAKGPSAPLVATPSSTCCLTLISERIAVAFPGYALLWRCVSCILLLVLIGVACLEWLTRFPCLVLTQKAYLSSLASIQTQIARPMVMTLSSCSM